MVTDHSCLLWLQNIRNPAGRLARWAMKLLAHDMNITHRKGSSHLVPDALSRMFEVLSEGETENVNAIITAQTQQNWYQNRIRKIQETPKKYPLWLVKDDRLYYRYVDPVKTAITRGDDEWKYVVPEADRERVLREAHEDVQAAHLGIDKTYNRLLIQYFWPGMYVDTVKFVHPCTPCEDLKVTQQKPVGLLGERIVEKLWTVVAADLMGPLPRSRSGFSFLLVIQDLFTKWVEIAPLRSATGPKIREKLDELVVTRWGTPRVFHSDNGTEFRNKAIAEYARDLKIHHSFSPPYRAEANPVERVNRVFKSMIAAYVNQDHKS